jgi:hypothetical protein
MPADHSFTNGKCQASQSASRSPFCVYPQIPCPPYALIQIAIQRSTNGIHIYIRQSMAQMKCRVPVCPHIKVEMQWEDIGSAGGEAEPVGSFIHSPTYIYINNIHIFIPALPLQNIFAKISNSTPSKNAFLNTRLGGWLARAVRPLQSALHGRVLQAD